MELTPHLHTKVTQPQSRKIGMNTLYNISLFLKEMDVGDGSGWKIVIKLMKEGHLVTFYKIFNIKFIVSMLCEFCELRRRICVPQSSYFTQI